jgi:hypothetical protein
MAYQKPFMRLSLSGTLYDHEAWSTGFTLINPNDPVGATFSDVPQAIRDAAIILITNGGIASIAKIDTIKFNLIGTDGKYVDKSNSNTFEVKPAGSGGGSVHPAPQLALAVSLRTGLSRGLAHAGRSYLPVPSNEPDGSGRLTAAAVVAYHGQMLDFVNSVNIGADGWRIGVVSNLRGGAQHLCTGIRIGRVLDTIRSRRTSMPEEYTDGTAVTHA